jgi:hypothetical protein
MNYTRLTKTQGDRAPRTGQEEIVLSLHRGNGYDQIVYDARGIYAYAHSYLKPDGSTGVTYYVADGKESAYVRDVTWIKALESMRDDIVDSIAPREVSLSDGVRVHHLRGVGTTIMQAIVDAVEKALLEASDLLFEDDRESWSSHTARRALTRPRAADQSPDNKNFRMAKFEIVR